MLLRRRRGDVRGVVGDKPRIRRRRVHIARVINRAQIHRVLVLNDAVLLLVLLFGQIEPLPFQLPVLIEVHFERGDVILESEGGDRPEDVVAVDRLPLLPLALVGGLAGDEADELRHALLDALLGVLGDLPAGRDDLLHDPADIGDWEELVLFLVADFGAGAAAILFGARSGAHVLGVSGPFIVVHGWRRKGGWMELIWC
ncbi:unnamed protein product [Cuscuta epithymum]|uniref:Uncharacterized protein n=1 Tax=Cuscuta epithymum TaxID=186058 RepID=A0AAV0EKM2_9ASTE|nr:unnamed protein product [Cuscuta epithymum]